jgi:phage N-6-adenine-methyltransferase
MTMTSNSDEWRTPKWVWEPWHRVLHFQIDAAATDGNKLEPCRQWYTLQRSGLDADWAEDIEKLGGGSVWLNPPYSRKGGPLLLWVDKAISEANKGVVVCMLLPADVSTDWFTRLWSRNAGAWNSNVQGFFSDQRIKLLHPETGKAAGSPTFGSLIAVISAPLPELRSEDEEDSVPDLIIAQDI